MVRDGFPEEAILELNFEGTQAWNSMKHQGNHTWLIAAKTEGAQGGERTIWRAQRSRLERKVGDILTNLNVIPKI